MNIVDDEDDEGTPLEQIVAGVVMALTFLVGFGLLALGNPFFWIAFPVGFAGVLPAAIGLVRLYESRQTEEADEAQSGTEDALATLRRRYANGELTEEEFEEKVERLLETETVADARNAVSARRMREPEPDVESEQN
ncbi:SHOCT domain-containing protein [Haloferax sp. MBLA0076]|uniref:SHOCT domain-containing protein n=2 Tax=Haloferacaceae TaxID=1644056 RepID=A0A6A8GC84_9EURY|nr:MULTISPECIES: SHOCT domain-containing protein [Haloferax]KAB1194773.1 SHOCT domain-containing protein [Haloferax sp. CBA1148]MRX20728.1 SHOCT domain-containing protein [Haloferax litoreum]